MSPIKLNFEGVTERGFAPRPVNEPIEFTIFSIEQAKGQESGEPYLKFEFKETNSNRKAWTNMSLQPQVLWRLKKLLVELDYDKEDLEAEFDFDPKEILGRTVYLKFGPERPSGQNNDDGTPKMKQEITSITSEV